MISATALPINLLMKCEGSVFSSASPAKAAISHPFPHARSVNMPGLNIRWLTAVALLGVILLASVGTDPVLAHKTLHVATPPFPFTGSLDCPAPTASFDPATASKAELDFYGLPSRPTGSRSSISHWLDVVGHSRHRLCTAPIAGSVSSRPTPYSHTNNTDPFWSGIAVVNGGYNYAFSDWTVPCYSG